MEEQEAEINSQTISNINQIISNLEQSKSHNLYRKWSNGAVSYMGKLFFEYYEIIPEQSSVIGVKLLPGGYKVLDVTSEGARIITFKRNSFDLNHENDFFVEGLGGVFSDRTYVTPTMIRKIGAHTYSTVNGGSRTIPKYEIGERSTKQDYLEFVASSKTNKVATPKGK